MERLLAFLDQIHPLSSSLQEHLSSIIRKKTFQRKEFLLEAGGVSRQIFFIEHGIVRCFYMLGEREISAWFMQENDVVVAVDSFFGVVPSAEFIQALEPTSVLYITHDQLEEVYQRFPSFNANGRILLTHYYRLSEQRAISMRSQKSKQRYAFLLQNHPDLLQRVPRKHLASYLGITEATLSHINSGPIIKHKNLSK
jgi:CRP-like cAMP-binding protein